VVPGNNACCSGDTLSPAVLWNGGLTTPVYFPHPVSIADWAMAPSGSMPCASASIHTAG
jgi:hypothetical protein